MGKFSVKILVVEDFEEIRQWVCSTLRERPELEVIGEASDGLEAVQKAEALQPDLIVLDIGLPTLNGLHAARRIRKLAPKSKILFLSMESSADIVQEALSLGALGYVVKADAGTELLSAVEAVCQGKRFVSGRLAGHDFGDAGETQVPDCSCDERALPSLAQRHEETSRRHEVEFYSDDASFVTGFASFIEGALNSGKPVIAITTESHRKGLLERLQAHGVDVAAAIEQGRFIPVDAAEALSTFMVYDLPDPARLFKVGSELIEAAAKAAKGKHPRVVACGECSPILWAQGKADAAVQCEHLWDEIAKKHEVDILCGYVLTEVQREQERCVYEGICAEHSTVYSR